MCVLRQKSKTVHTVIDQWQQSSKQYLQRTLSNHFQLCEFHPRTFPNKFCSNLWRLGVFCEKKAATERVKKNAFRGIPFPVTSALNVDISLATSKGLIAVHIMVMRSVQPRNWLKGRLDQQSKHKTRLNGPFNNSALLVFVRERNHRAYFLFSVKLFRWKALWLEVERDNKTDSHKSIQFTGGFLSVR